MTRPALWSTWPDLVRQTEISPSHNLTISQSHMSWYDLTSTHGASLVSSEWLVFLDGLPASSHNNLIFATLSISSWVSWERQNTPAQPRVAKTICRLSRAQFGPLEEQNTVSSVTNAKKSVNDSKWQLPCTNIISDLTLWGKLYWQGCNTN